MSDVSYFDFSDDIKQLVALITNGVFSSRKSIFLGELIANVSDALDESQYRSLKEGTRLDESELRIMLTLDRTGKMLTIENKGLGMTKSELIQLGTMSNSGTKAAIKALQSGADISMIRHFGVRFYFAYLVTNRAEVTTKSSNDEMTYTWSSQSLDKFSVKQSKDSSLVRGTRIVLCLQDDMREHSALQNAKKTSKFIRVPVMYYDEKFKSLAADIADEEVCGVDDELQTKVWQQWNSAKPLWTYESSYMSKGIFDEFYKSISDDCDNYTFAKHVGDTGFRAILFCPTLPLFDLIDNGSKKRRNPVQLFAQGVPVMEGFEAFMPEWLCFVKGVVDVDIEFQSLNEKRSEIQIYLVDECIKMFRDANDFRYMKFYKEYGPFLKLGILQDARNRAKIAKLLRYFSSKNGDEMISLDDYVGCMKEDQPGIYFAMGESKEAVGTSSFLRYYLEKGYDVMFIFDPTDLNIVATLTEYSSKRLIYVTDDGNNAANEVLNPQSPVPCGEELYVLAKMAPRDSLPLTMVALNRKLRDQCNFGLRHCEIDVGALETLLLQHGSTTGTSGGHAPEVETIDLKFLDGLRSIHKECFLPKTIVVRESMRLIFRLFCTDNGVIRPRYHHTVLIGSPGVGKSILFFLAALYRSRRTITIYFRRSGSCREPVSCFIMFPNTNNNQVQIHFTREADFDDISKLRHLIQRTLSIDRYQYYTFVDEPRYDSSTLIDGYDYLCTSDGHPPFKSSEQKSGRMWVLDAWTEKEAISGLNAMGCYFESDARNAYWICGGNIRGMLRAVAEPMEVKNCVDHTFAYYYDKNQELAVVTTVRCQCDLGMFRREDCDDTTVMRVIQIVDSQYLLGQLCNDVTMGSMLKGWKHANMIKANAVKGHFFEYICHKWFALTKPPPVESVCWSKGSTKDGVAMLDKRNLYWVSRVYNFPEIDSAVVIEDTIYVFQMTVAGIRSFRFRYFKATFLDNVLEQLGKAKIDINKVVLTILVPVNTDFDLDAIQFEPYTSKKAKTTSVTKKITITLLLEQFHIAGRE